MLWIRNSLIVLIGIGILLLPSLAKAATTAYSMKVVVTMPKGSEGEKPGTTMPSNTKISPCTPGATGKVNSVSLTITYNAGTPADKDIFIILFNPNYATPFIAFGKQTFPSSLLVTTTYTVVADLTTAAKTLPESIYLTRSRNSGGSITETILNVVLTGAADVAGTWQVTGIVADYASVDFDDPTTWSAWDTGTFMIRKPWLGAINTGCQ
jgi:hypothetical protein